MSANFSDFKAHAVCEEILKRLGIECSETNIDKIYQVIDDYGQVRWEEGSDDTLYQHKINPWLM